MERVRRPEAFPRWTSPITRPRPDTSAVPRPEPNPRTRLTALRHHGWTVWFGQHTRQYWAAHTGTMRLVCADTPEELLRVITATAGRPSTTRHRGL